MFAKGLPWTWEILPISTSAHEGRGLRHRRSTDKEPVNGDSRFFACGRGAWYCRTSESESGERDGRKSERLDGTEETGEAIPDYSGHQAG
jgi:hypothetical protein